MTGRCIVIQTETQLHFYTLANVKNQIATVHPAFHLSKLTQTLFEENHRSSYQILCKSQSSSSAHVVKLPTKRLHFGNLLQSALLSSDMKGRVTFVLFTMYIYTSYSSRGQTFRGRERLVTITSIPWTTPECWRDRKLIITRKRD